MRLRTPVPQVAALITAAVAAGCGNSTSASTGPHKAQAAGPVSVTLSEFKLAPSATKAKGPSVTFDVQNDGKMPHEFVVLRTTKQAAGLGHASKINEAGNVGETGDIAPGKSKSLTLHLKPGHYSLVCNLPGHYMAGMHRDFTVT
jgi:uncharacterized cupredoxin-like copper-binding protein